MKGDFARMCGTVTSGNSRGRGRNINHVGMSRVKLIGPEGGHSSTGRENDENNMVLHINGLKYQSSKERKKGERNTARTEQPYHNIPSSGTLSSNQLPKKRRVATGRTILLTMETTGDNPKTQENSRTCRNGKKRQ